MTLVLDNLSTHSGASSCKSLSPVNARALLDKVELVRTPKHGGWLNMAELEFGVRAPQCQGRRAAGLETSREQVSAWTDRRNRRSKVVY